MRVSLFLYCVFTLSPVYAGGEFHNYLIEDGYNDVIRDENETALKFIETAFPELFGRPLLPFDGHFKVIAGYEKRKFLAAAELANVVVIPDLVDGLSTRASTMLYIRQFIQAGEAIVFVHDSINMDASKTVAPQTFWCRHAFFRAPQYLDPKKFESELWGMYLDVHGKFETLNGCQCFRLGLAEPSPARIKAYIEEMTTRKLAPKRYFVVMDQRQMPGQKNAQYSIEDWNAAFGKDGYTMLIDLYAKTSRE